MQIPLLMRRSGDRCFPLLPHIGILLLSPALFAQQPAPTNASKPNPIADDDTVLSLTPFEVHSGKETGYAVRDTLASSRLNTELRDVASQIQIMSTEMLQDIGTVTVEDAFRYSINVENTSEFSASSAGDFNNRVINPSSDNRIRGLTTSGRTHDFFETSIFLDAYNTDRITYSSGPNAILFGVGKPAGIVDITFNRARLNTSRCSVMFRVDNYNSHRTSIDIEQPIIRNVFAIRVDALNQSQNTFRAASGDETKRLFGTFTFKPFKRTTLRGWMEHARINATQARNTVFTDRVTPWIAAGRPLFNNGTSANGVTPSPASNDPLFSRYTVTKPVFVFGQTAATVPFMVWGSSASSNPLTNASARYSVTTKGPGDLAASPDNFPYSMTDGSVFPLDVNVHGNGTRNLMTGQIRGLTIEQQFGENFFAEVSYNQETNRNDFTDIMRGTQNSLYVDTNQFLPDRVTPNPNVGRYYFEGSGRGGIRRFEREEYRATMAYDLDLTKINTWLGRHRFGLLAQRTFSVDGQQDSDMRIVPDGVNPVDAWTNSTYAYQWRAYVSDPRNPATGSIYHLQLPFDPLRTTKIPGYTIYTADNPYGATTRATNLKSVTLQGTAFSVQSHLLKNRLVSTIGWRNDRVWNWSAVDQPGLLRQLGSGTSTSAWLPILETPIGTTNRRYINGGTSSAGGVFHVTKNFSVFYNHSTGWNAAPGTRYPDSSYLVGSQGRGTDYGIRLSILDDRLALRVNRYHNTSGPDASDFRSTIRNPVNDIEVIIDHATQAGQIKPPPTTFYTGMVATYEVTSLSDARGYEFELTANLTPNWRLTLNGTKGETVESDIGAQWIAYVKQRMKVWSDNADLTDPETTSKTTVRDIFRTLINDLNLMKQADGRATEQARGTRVNLVTRYLIDKGCAKGLFFGAGYRWRSKSVIGYKTQVLPNEFPFSGIPDTIAVPDINSPVHGRPINETELFLGYSRKLGRKVTWKTQLNIRNVFDADGIIGQRSNSVGSISVYTLPEPRSFVLTNTFSF